MRGSEFYRSLVVERLLHTSRLRPSTFVLDGADAVLSMAGCLRDQNGGSLVESAYPGPNEGLYLSIADPAKSTHTWR
jgi:hypothetical protein